MELPTTPVVKSSRLKSAVWNDFERVKKGDVMVAICKHCKKKLSASATSGTSHLKNHLIRCRKRCGRELTQQVLVVRGNQKDSTFNFGSYQFGQDLSPMELKFDHEQSRLDLKFDSERSRLDLSRMIILHEYPLSIVEDDGFKRFVENLQPSFKLMSSNIVKSDCLQIYGNEKQKVYQILDKIPSRISLKADMWGSSQENKYLCLTAHYLDATWVPQKKILSFVMVDPNQEFSVAEVIVQLLMDWDIDRKLSSITFDDNFTNDVVFRIRDRLTQNRLLLNSGQLFHVRCAVNILKLIVQEILEAIHEETHKIREIIKYIKSSEGILQKFNEIAQQVIGGTERCLYLDCPSQWNSTYFMLESAIMCKDVFRHLQEFNSSYAPILSDVEWERVGVVCSYLKLFVEVNTVFSGAKYPTANLYFPDFCDINLQLVGWCNSSDLFASSLALKMRSKFDTYWSICGLVLAIAAILDPRYKMKLVEYYYRQIYGSNAQDYIKDVASGMKDLHNEYAVCATLTSFDHGLPCEVQNSNGLNVALPIDSDSRDRLRGFDKFLNETTDNQQIKSELDKYLDEPVFPRNVDFNILSWWKVNAPKYPILSMMARDVLGIPICTFTSESAFSTGGRVLDQNRTALEPDILQALICAHDWLRTELEGSKTNVVHL
ncbi:hypothetical protein Scep_011849 [Stephania cephalantha]|uniref:BED-type domain-containing protein n=1 Tax=Stephania cephalantha TaxID=152367 RepID=A0AAP0JDW1_9MAGN